MTHSLCRRPKILDRILATRIGASDFAISVGVIPRNRTHVIAFNSERAALLAALACHLFMTRSSAPGIAPQRRQSSTEVDPSEAARRIRTIVTLFGISGFVTTGFIETHLVMIALSRGVKMADAGAMMAMFGGINVIGTLCSGWAADRIKPTVVLSWIVVIRIITLAGLIAVEGKAVLLLFCIGSGLTNFAMVPVVNALVGRVSSDYAAPRVFGWAAASDQAGSAAGALTGGVAFWVAHSFDLALAVCIALSGYSLVLVRTLARILRSEQ